MQHLILNNTDYWAASFNNVIKVNFTQPQNLPDPADHDDIGTIVFGQLQGSHSAWNEGTAALTQIAYDSNDPLSDEAYGDIFFNVDHEASAGGLEPGNNIWTDFGDMEEGTFAYKTIYEEISHALGIDFFSSEHPEELNQKYTVTAYAPYGYVSDANNSYLPILDNDPLSVILYGEDNDGDGEQDVLSAYGLQLYDIAALQELYGRDYLARANDDEYKLGQGLGRDGNNDDVINSNDKDSAFVYTIWDGAGEDTIDASGFDIFSAKIDLRQGAFSSIGTDGKNGALFEWSEDGAGGIVISKDAENVAIAYHTVIENAVGTSNNDILIGNDWGNTLNGGEGDDYLYGDGAVYDGDHGFTDIDTNDTSDPNRSLPIDDIDTLYGGAGNDTLIGGVGNDYLYGDDGTDTADYSEDAAQGGTAGVTATLDADGNGTAIDGFGDTDTLYSIEKLTLTEYDDTVNLDAPSGRIINGGISDDTVNYSYDVVADYNSGEDGEVVIWDENAGVSDTLIDIENVAYTATTILPDYEEDVGLATMTLGNAAVVTNDYSAYEDDLTAHFTLGSTYSKLTMPSYPSWGGGVEVSYREDYYRGTQMSIDLRMVQNTEQV